MITPATQYYIIAQNTVQITPAHELQKKLSRGIPLVIKLGVDPTAPDLHLGHLVVLEKLKDFQQLGHTVIFLIGDFTARIGDPTGKNKTRPPLTPESIAENMVSYFQQVKRVLDPETLIIRYNSEWLASLGLADLIKLCSQVTLARITEREDFAQRIAEQKSISLHEILYPLMQGYDSVALKADVELGGTDQTFNLLMGRLLQEQHGQEPQVIITVPLLEGTNGGDKMSKSLGNAIGLNETADNAFGKLMSLSDAVMWHFMSLLLRTPAATIITLQKEVADGITHPMALKKDMAYRIVARYWSEEQAHEARERFVALFQKKDMSQAHDTMLMLPSDNHTLKILELLKEIKAVSSSGEGRRLIEAGAVKINNDTVTQITAEIECHTGMTVKVGKHRLYKLKINE